MTSHNKHTQQAKTLLITLTLCLSVLGQTDITLFKNYNYSGTQKGCMGKSGSSIIVHITKGILFKVVKDANYASTTSNRYNIAFNLGGNEPGSICDLEGSIYFFVGFDSGKMSLYEIGNTSVQDTLTTSLDEVDLLVHIRGTDKAIGGFKKIGEFLRTGTTISEPRSLNLGADLISSMVQATSNLFYVSKAAVNQIQIISLATFTVSSTLSGAAYNFAHIVNPTFSLDTTLYGLKSDKKLSSLTVSDNSVNLVLDLGIYEPTGIVELQGFDSLAISHKNGKVLIFKISDSSLTEYDVSATSGEIHGLCFLPDSVMIGLVTNNNANKVNIYKMEPYCHTNCSGFCYQPPAVGDNKCYDCPVAPAHTLNTVNNSCEITCVAGSSYPNSTYSACVNCPACCAANCSLDPSPNPSVTYPYIPNNVDLTCSAGNLSAGFDILDGACETLTDMALYGITSGTLTPTEAKVSILFEKKIPFNFDLTKVTVVITEDSVPWVEGIDYSLNLAPDILDPQEFILTISILKIGEFSATVDVQTAGLQFKDASGADQNYGSETTNFPISSTVIVTPPPPPSNPQPEELEEPDDDKLINLPPQIEVLVKESNFYFTEGGFVLAQFFPPLGNVISSMNILKLIALFPVELPKMLVSLLNLLVSFPEKGTFKWFPDSIYGEEYIGIHTLAPKNEEFTFQSVYPRMRMFKIVLRIILNIFFFSCLPRIFSSKSSKNKVKFLLMKRFLGFVVTLDHANFGTNVLLLATSIQQKITLFDFVVIAVDFISLVSMQWTLLKIYLKFKNRNSREIQDPIQLEIALSIFYLQKGEDMHLPFQLEKTLHELMRITCLFLLYNYKIAFGYAFTAVNGWILFSVLSRVLAYRTFYTRSFLVLKFSQFLEAMFFTLMGVYCINHENWLTNKQYSNICCYSLLVWIGAIILSAFILIFMRDHRNHYSTLKPTRLEKIIFRKKKQRIAQQASPADSVRNSLNPISPMSQLKISYIQRKIKIKFDPKKNRDFIKTNNQRVMGQRSSLRLKCKSRKIKMQNKNKRRYKGHSSPVVKYSRKTPKSVNKNKMNKLTLKTLKNNLLDHRNSKLKNKFTSGGKPRTSVVSASPLMNRNIYTSTPGLENKSNFTKSTKRGSSNPTSFFASSARLSGSVNMTRKSAHKRIALAMNNRKVKNRKKERPSVIIEEIEEIYLKRKKKSRFSNFLMDSEQE